MPDVPAGAEDPFLKSLIEQISELEEGADPAFPLRRSSSLPDPKPLLDALSAGPPEAPHEAAPGGEDPLLEEAFSLDEPDAFAGPAEEPAPQVEEPALELEEPLDLGEPLPPEAQDHEEPEVAPPPPADVTLDALDETIAEEIDDLLGDYDAAPDLEPSAPARTAAAPEPAAPPEPIDEIIEAVPPQPPEAPAGKEGVRRALSNVVAPAWQHVVTALHTLGAPVRALPPSTRLIVDFFALSLLLWVPLVWLIALFVVGK